MDTGAEQADGARVRPGPLQWLRYVWTGKAPPQCRSWVLHDTTSRFWLARHVVRFLAQLSPAIAAVLVLLPAPLPVRLACTVVGVLGTVVFAFGYTVEGAERRVERAGYPYGTASQLREQRALVTQRATAARLRAKREARLARRAGTDGPARDDS